MTTVLIDGVEYVPKADIPPLTDERMQSVLEVLTSMRYFGEEHKMETHAWEAINALSPNLAILPAEEAYYLIHGTED